VRRDNSLSSKCYLSHEQGLLKFKVPSVPATAIAVFKVTIPRKVVPLIVYENAVQN
jgi:hypothetical protein